MFLPEKVFSKSEINKVPNLTLAYMGDSVYELMVREYLISKKTFSHSELHNAALRFVSAPAQAENAKKLIGFLTEEELTEYKRGRNAKVNSVPHNSTTEQYHAATGLETLFGYLYLTGALDRLNELFSMITGDKNAI